MQYNWIKKSKYKMKSHFEFTNRNQYRYKVTRVFLCVIQRDIPSLNFEDRRPWKMTRKHGYVQLVSNKFLIRQHQKFAIDKHCIFHTKGVII